MAASTTPGQPTGSVGGAPAGGGPTGRPDHNGIGATRIEPNRSAMVSAASARRALAEPGEVGRRGSAVWRVVIGCTGARVVAEAAASAPPPVSRARAGKRRFRVRWQRATLSAIRTLLGDTGTRRPPHDLFGRSHLSYV